jgi:hypothetical protein
VSDTAKFTIKLPCLFRFIEARPADIDGDQIASRAPSVNVINRTRVLAATRMIEARLAMPAKIDASHLPDIAKAKLRQAFEDKTHFTEADVEAAIKNEREYLYRMFQNSVI